MEGGDGIDAILRVEMTLSHDSAGRIIGRGGATINQIRSQSGASVDIAKRVPGSSRRAVTIIGTSEQCHIAEQMISQIATSAPDNARGGGGGGGGFPAPRGGSGDGGGGGFPPPNDGRGGAPGLPGMPGGMSWMQENQMPPPAGFPEPSGFPASLGAVGMAPVQLQQQPPQEQQQQQPPPQQPPRQQQQQSQSQQTESLELQLPDGTAGLIIGRGGRTINRIRETSGATVNVSKKGQGRGSGRTVSLQGTNQQIEVAQRMISDEIQMKMQKESEGGQGGQRGDGYAD
jgi:predicted RNA-binding protein YlqC (UPF0109 family)